MQLPIPAFRTIEPYQPRRSALVQGGLLTAALFFAAVWAIGHGGRVRQLLIGVQHPRAGLLPVATASTAKTGLNAAVQLPAEPEDPLRPVAISYFRMIRVLAVLDNDGDQIISPWEMLTAPAALRRLDWNHDGKLSADECGFRMGRDSLTPDVIKRARRAFMRENPVLAALDANHDGEISAAEIEHSSANLQKLDRNGDGSLTPDELLPDHAAYQAAMIMARYDTNDDGVISLAERSTVDAAMVREFLESADRDHDGVVTRQELEYQISFSVEQHRERDLAKRRIGAR